MPTPTAISGLEISNKYNDLIDALQNFNRWGIQVQSLAAILQADANYLTLMSSGERTALTNFLNTINSIIPIANIPNKAT